MDSNFPETGKDKKKIIDEIKRACSSDYSYQEGRILNSICSEPLPVAVEAYCQTIHTNLGDVRIFPGVKKIERAVTQMIGDLLSHPGAAGNVVSGGTEANLLALLAARNKNKNITSPEVVVPFSIHFSVNKAASILGLKLRYTKLDHNQHADPKEIERSINSNTIAIMATAGTSETGAVDPIPEIASIAKKHNLYFHVDAASGGFIIPFAKELGYNLPDFDFKIKKVDSITVDPHKYALSVIPSGYILFRSKEIQKLVGFESHYVGTETHTTFAGTRPGASAASTYAVIKYLGRQGFKELVKGCFNKRNFLINELEKQGLKILIPPDLNIVIIKSKNPKKAMRMLEDRRWLVSMSKRNNALRAVVHHHLQKEHLRAFAEELSAIERSL